MNISTGGPHLLLFERDQQLAALLGSELQLAGYEIHTARTAVEVFDAIARYPIRLVLVNMAQAAAARQEFWVALDTQRRGSGIQVLTFRCSNLAGYGQRDPDERTAGVVDMDVDGMLGLMNLVDGVRLRVPWGEGAASTMPRLPRTTANASQRSSQQQTASAPSFGNTTSYRAGALSEQTGSHSALRTQPQPSGPNRQANSTTFAPAAVQPSSASAYAPSAASGMQQQAAGEKIRAVLYPNQRTWSAQNSPTMAETALSNANSAPGASAASVEEASILQRLAGGTLDGQKESGLDQLSRLVQGYQSPTEESKARSRHPETLQTGTAQATTVITPTEQTPSEVHTPPPAVSIPANDLSNYSTSGVKPQFTGDGNGNGQATRQAVAQEHPATPTARVTQENEQASTNEHRAITRNAAQTSASNGAGSYVPPRPAPGNERISTQPLRAAPIQDMPLERPLNGQSATEANSRRPDVLARANYGQQTNAATTSPLASIATARPFEPKTAAPPAEAQTPASSVEAQGSSETRPPEVRAPEPAPTIDDIQTREITDTVQHGKEHNAQAQNERNRPEGPVGGTESITANNAVILDILQSLPPMPALTQQQAVQPQVLNGRATRTLGSVLLDGHLVPQDRLEVAQNIQRMLRGVDLNYQLGEILLMFKLLTPDQLLAASLVSYGLITTTQISALGRIRQELHSIGLEYDLENLIILFRILSPEQLREVRASLQG